MKKYMSPFWFSLAAIIALVDGLEVPFNTATYAYIFKLITNRDRSDVGKYLIVVLIGFLFFSVFSYVQSVVVNKNIVHINQHLKNEVIQAKVERADLNQENFEASGLSFLMNDLKLLEDNYWRNLFRLLGYASTVIVTLGYALLSNFKLTLIFLSFMVVPTLFQHLIGHNTTVKTAVWSKQNEQLSTRVKDLLHGALTIRRYHAETGYHDRLNADILSTETANARLKNGIALANSIMVYLFYLFSETPIAIGIFFTITGVLTLPQFVAVQYSSNMILNSANQIMRCFNQISSTKTIRQQVQSTTKSVGDCDGPKLLTKMGHFKSLLIANVSFYRDSHEVLKDLHLSLKTGEKVLIQGASGAGKSTLLRIILKELPIDGGRLMMNSDDYNSAQVNAVFSEVSQAPVVFDETILFNLTLGMEVPKERVVNAIQQAGLASIITSKNWGERLSENGQNLSGGQLKQLEIARALAFKREGLLIDEGTASLDPAIAKQIHETLLAIPNLTIIEVDHHIPDVIKAKFDHVYLLSEGHLIETSH